MNDRLKKLRDDVQARGFKRYRTSDDAGSIVLIGSDAMRNSALFKQRCAMETPQVFPEEKIAFLRTRATLIKGVDDPHDKWRPSRLMRSLRVRLARFIPALMPHLIHWEPIHNVCPDYGLLLKDGLEGLRGDAARNASIDALLALVSRYRVAAESVGNRLVADMLGNVPAHRPATFLEALQSVRIVSSALYLADVYQCGFGRMDQYLWPFYQADIASGRITRDEAREYLEEFFISLNKDADLYFGIQQGDNGQSIMLGGCDPKTGASAINDLTYLIMEAARETRLIDPKINLRVDRNTPVDLLELGSSLTKCALGFPQYSNDEVVIPALVAHGYDLEDARNYTVAACWEFIIPGKGLEVVNQGAVSFPHAVDSALRDEVATGSFDEASFRHRIAADIRRQIHATLEGNDVRLRSSPLAEMLFDTVKYRNVGIHGAGSANAADQIAGLKFVYEKEGLTGLQKLIAAENDNFEREPDLLAGLLGARKVGNDEESVDQELTFLFNAFADAAEKISPPRLEGFRGKRITRPGSGSAMGYVQLTDTEDFPDWPNMVGATSDGRKRNAPLGSSLAPSHEARVNGVLSVFKSFAHVDYARIMNGGPVTIELSHTVFASAEGEKKLAQLIRYFVALGLQQLQLNVLDVKELQDALEHPERHRNLIVRVWGWSGYFCELDRKYQMQIIRRHTYGS